MSILSTCCCFFFLSSFRWRKQYQFSNLTTNVVEKMKMWDKKNWQRRRDHVIYDCWICWWLGLYVREIQNIRNTWWSRIKLTLFFVTYFVMIDVDFSPPFWKLVYFGLINMVVCSKFWAALVHLVFFLPDGSYTSSDFC